MTSSGTRSASAQREVGLAARRRPRDANALDAGRLAHELLTAQEQSIEILERDQSPRRPAVIARLAALGALHLAQQRVHLLDRQAAARAHRGVTRHRRQQLVGSAPRRADVPCPSARSLKTSRTNGSTSLPSSSKGTARTATCCGPRRATSSPTAASSSANCSTRSASRAETSKLDRHEQRLRLQALRGQRRLEPFVGDALVRRVHVDDDQARRVLREHVDARKLRQRDSRAAAPPPHRRGRRRRRRLGVQPLVAAAT